jgi:hypothetical protein
MQRYLPRRSTAFLNRSAARRRHVLVGMFLLAPAVIGAQEIGPVSFRDSLVMRQVAYRAPCPSPVPASWTLADSTLGSGLRCSLVEWAVRALEAQLEQRPSLKARTDPRNPLCVRVVVASNTGATGLLGDWTVVFDLSHDTPAYVMIDRQTGGVAMAIIGRDQAFSDLLPVCTKRSAWRATRLSTGVGDRADSVRNDDMRPGTPYQDVVERKALHRPRQIRESDREVSETHVRGVGGIHCYRDGGRGNERA